MRSRGEEWTSWRKSRATPHPCQFLSPHPKRLPLWHRRHPLTWSSLHLHINNIILRARPFHPIKRYISSSNTIGNNDPRIARWCRPRHSRRLAPCPHRRRPRRAKKEFRPSRRTRRFTVRWDCPHPDSRRRGRRLPIPKSRGTTPTIAPRTTPSRRCRSSTRVRTVARCLRCITERGRPRAATNPGRIRAQATAKTRWTTPAAPPPKMRVTGPCPIATRSTALRRCGLATSAVRTWRRGRSCTLDQT
mmetsp:Transcript_5041/g.10881  ORF Transcript_5041/g.10881 Transcript_5041/m.10881 type:complete len:247 (+) Transcript_5041:599-1339(+)